MPLLTIGYCSSSRNIPTWNVYWKPAGPIRSVYTWQVLDTPFSETKSMEHLQSSINYRDSVCMQKSLDFHILPQESILKQMHHFLDILSICSQSLHDLSDNKLDFFRFFDIIEITMTVKKRRVPYEYSYYNRKAVWFCRP